VQQSTRVSAPEAKTAHPRPTQVTLAVVFQVRNDGLHVLLWERAKEPFAATWALPGGYLEPGETLEQSIRRQLALKVDLRDLAHLEQLETRSEPRRHPGEWPETFTLSELRQIYAAALGHDVSATNLKRVLLRRGLLEPTGETRTPGRTGGRPAACYRFCSRALEITDQFAILRPPREPTSRTPSRRRAG
jgi:ADP-ribose pyrophosphatase YjhB (NUDIX family)